MWWWTFFFLVPKHQFIIIVRWIQVAFQLLHFSFISLCSSQTFAAANIDAIGAHRTSTDGFEQSRTTIVNDIMETAKKLNRFCEWLLFLWCRKRCHNRSPFLWIIITLWIVDFFLLSDSLFFFIFFSHIVHSDAYSHYAVSVEMWTFLVFGIQWNSLHLTRPIHFRRCLPSTNSATTTLKVFHKKNKSCLYFHFESIELNCLWLNKKIA